MDTIEPRSLILSRLMAGDITKDQAEQEFDALLSPPRRKRGRPNGSGKRFKLVFIGKNKVELKPPKYQRKASLRELEIGFHYVGQIESGIRPLIAEHRTLKRYSTKRNPLDGASVERYGRAYRADRKKSLERIRLMQEAHKVLDEMQRSPIDQLMKVLDEMQRSPIDQLMADQDSINNSLHSAHASFAKSLDISRHAKAAMDAIIPPHIRAKKTPR